MPVWGGELWVFLLYHLGHTCLCPSFIFNILCVCVCVCVYSVAQSCLALCDPMDCSVAHQAPLSMGFSWQENWSGLPLPSSGDLSNPEIEPASLVSPALAGRFFTTMPPGKPFPCNFIVNQWKGAIILPILQLNKLQTFGTGVWQDEIHLNCMYIQ